MTSMSYSSISSNTCRQEWTRSCCLSVAIVVDLRKRSYFSNQRVLSTITFRSVMIEILHPQNNTHPSISFNNMITSQNHEHDLPQEQYQYPSYYLPHSPSIAYPAVTGVPSQTDGQSPTAFTSSFRYDSTSQHQTAQNEKFPTVYGVSYPAYFQADPVHNAQWLPQPQRYQYSSHSPIMDLNSYPASISLGLSINTSS